MNHDRVMLLIDADNVSLDVIEQAVPWVHQHFGGPHVRRAYCTAESAVKHQAAFKRLGIRPMVNLAAGKNSTDIALAVDAIDLAIVERPQVVVIASSDSDFAPLVSRLREKGCRVVGVGQQGKTGDETIGVYDDYEVMAHRKAASVRAAPAAPTKAPAKKRAPRKAPAKKAVVAAIPDKAQAIFDALPALAAGESVELRVAAERLREAQLLSRSGSSTKLFGQFPELFELRPEKQPNHVQRRTAR
jgi:NYN domain